MSNETPWKEMPVDAWLLVFTYLDFKALRLLSFLHASNLADAHTLFWQQQFKLYFPALYTRMKTRDEKERVDWYVKFNHAEKEECDDDAEKNKSKDDKGFSRRWFREIKKSIYLQKKNNFSSYLASAQDTHYAMIRACKGGHLALVKALEHRGELIRMRKTQWRWYYGGFTKEESWSVMVIVAERDRNFPLIIAAAYGHVELVAYLIEKGAKVDEYFHSWEKEKDESGELSRHSALYRAASKGHFDVVQLLITKGAILSCGQPEFEDKAVYIACKQGYLDIAQLLIRNQPVFLNLKNSKAMTLLHLAIKLDHRELVMLLFKLSAELAEPLDIQSSLCYAINLKKNAMIAFILQCKVEVHSAVFHRACFCGELEIVKLLLEYNPHLLEQTNQEKRTPIFSAIRGCSLPVVTYLAEQGANLHHQVWNEPPFLYAILHGSDDGIPNFLLTQDTPIDRVSHFNKMGAIHCVCRRNNVKMAAAILKKQPDLLNQRDRENQTPAYRAAESGCTEIITYLIEQGADFKIKGNRLSPLREACAGGNIDAMKLILNKEPSLLEEQDYAGHTLFRFVMNLRIRNDTKQAIMLFLLQQGANPNYERFSTISSPLHFAVMHNKVELARELIQKGADINALYGRLSARDYCIHLACAKGHVEMVELLLAAQPNFLNQLNERGFTPLHCAAMYEQARVVHYLVRKGADVTIKNPQAQMESVARGQCLMQLKVLELAATIERKKEAYTG